MKRSPKDFFSSVASWYWWTPRKWENYFPELDRPFCRLKSERAKRFPSPCPQKKSSNSDRLVCCGFAWMKGFVVVLVCCVGSFGVRVDSAMVLVTSLLKVLLQMGISCWSWIITCESWSRSTNPMMLYLVLHTFSMQINVGFFDVPKRHHSVCYWQLQIDPNLAVSHTRREATITAWVTF